MIAKPFLILFLSVGLLASGEAFVFRSSPKTPLVVLRETSAIRTATNIDDTNPGDTTVDPKLVKLQHEYKILQEKLLKDVVLAHDEDDAEIIEEQMIEIAERATKIHEEHQKEILREAEHTMEDVQAARQRLHELREQETAMELDTVRHMNVDVYDQLALYSDLEELAARHKVAAAKTLLSHLEENEKKLHAALEQLKKEHDQSENKIKKEETVHTHHRSFLDKVKGVIMAHPDIFISLDPHIL